MSAGFHVRVHEGVVVVTHVGDLQFEDASQSIVAAAEAARTAGSKLVLFNLTRAELPSYYSYSVRQAELAPKLGLDTSYRIAIVGVSAADDMLSFMEMVAQNRGWQARRFFDAGEAMRWLQQAP